MSENDELDRQIHAAYRELGEQVPLAGVRRELIAVPPRRVQLGRPVAWLVAPIAAALVLVLALGPFGTVSPPRPAQTKLPTQVAAATPSQTSQASGFVRADWVAQRPAVVEGPFGATDVSAYGPDGPDTLAERPLENEGFAGHFGGSEPGSGLAIDGIEHLASMTRHVIRGRVIAISRPYFNSADGSFWLPELVGTDAGRAVSPMLLRDVLIEVEDVLAGSPPMADGRLLMTVPGGQAVVDVSEDIPFGKGYGDHVLEAGRYLWTDEPATDLAIDEVAVYFLNDVPLDGLFAGDGTRYGYVFRLMPAEERSYKLAVDGGRLVGSPAVKGVTLTTVELDAQLKSDHFASAAGPEPDSLVHEQSPDH